MSELLVNTIKKADGTGSLSVPAESGTVVTTASPSLGRRNLILNGSMTVAQRATSTSGITGNGYHTVDRFDTNLNGLGTWTQSQSTTVPSGQGFSHSLKMDCTTANASPGSVDRLFIRHKIEGQDLQHLKYGTSSAESLTISFWVRSNKTGTYTLHLISTIPAITTKQIGSTYTINVANTWEKKTITIVGDTSDGIVDGSAYAGLNIHFCLGAGSGYTSGTFATSWEAYDATNRIHPDQVNLADNTANEWYITGVQLEVGSVASSYEHRSYGEELALCQRYYQRITKLSTDSQVMIANGLVWTTNNGLFTLPYNVQMRAAPTAIEVSSVTDFRTMSAANGVDTVNMLFERASKYSIQIRGVTGSGQAQGDATALRIEQNDGYIGWSAEL